MFCFFSWFSNKKSIRNSDRFTLSPASSGGEAVYPLRGQFDDFWSASTLDRPLLPHAAPEFRPEFRPEFLPRRRLEECSRMPSALSESLCHRVWTAAGRLTLLVWRVLLVVSLEVSAVSPTTSDVAELRKKVGCPWPLVFLCLWLVNCCRWPSWLVRGQLGVDLLVCGPLIVTAPAGAPEIEGAQRRQPEADHGHGNLTPCPGKILDKVYCREGSTSA